MRLFLKARMDWACSPANRKDQPTDYEKAMQMFLNVARLDEACLPGGYGHKAHWFVKRGALLYLYYYSQDITDLVLQHSTSSCTCDAGHATPAHGTHYILLAISQMTSPAICHRCGYCTRSTDLLDLYL
jgi:hypothetical protein